MKNKLIVMGILATVLVFGMAFIGCDSDEGDDDSITIDGWKWVAYTDAYEGGTSTITMTQGTGSNSNRLTFAGNLTANVPNGEWDPLGWAGCDVYPNNEKLTTLKNADGISFKCKGNGKSYSVQVLTSDVIDYAYYRYTFTAPETEGTIKLPYDYFHQPAGWGTSVNFNKNNIQRISFQAQAGVTEKGSFDVTIWDLQVGNP